MAPDYYSDRVQGPRPRVAEEFTEDAWGGIVAIVSRGIGRPLFAENFPEMCPDGNGPCGCDERALRLAARAELPNLDWPPDERDVPPTLDVLDLIEFLHRHSSLVVSRKYHDFYRHHDIQRFDRQRGRDELRDQVNTVLARNGLAYELEASGNARRIAPPVVRELVRCALPRTGDKHLDRLLEAARTRFTDPDPDVRRDALEKVWDAFERIKTILSADKKQGARALIAGATSSVQDAQLVEEEMRTLTDIGNNFQIRHHEVSKASVNDSLVNYLFARIYVLLLRLHPVAARPGLKTR